MKNDFPIKNFENVIDQVRKLGYDLLSAILVTAELYSYPSQYWSQSPEASTRKREPLIMFIHKTSRNEGY